MSLKLGKLAPVPDKRDARYSAFRLPKTLPKRPRYFGAESLIEDWGMLGNDAAGDCVWAGAGHEHMLFCAESGITINFTPKDIIAAYSAVTGYVPGDDASDVGTECHQALKYRKDTGIIDGAGGVHKLGAFVRLEPGNIDHLLEALYLFGAVGIGIGFPSSAFDQFNSGKPWRVEKGSPIEGGHYVPLVAQRHEGLVCVTWGKLQVMTRAFYRTYCDEAWGLLSEDMLNLGRNPRGFDLKALREYLDEVGGEVE